MDKETLVNLISFLQDKEVHIEDNMSTLVFLNYYELNDFVEIFGKTYFEEDGIEINLLYNYVGIDLKECWFIEEEDLKIIRDKLGG